MSKQLFKIENEATTCRLKSCSKFVCIKYVPSSWSGLFTLGCEVCVAASKDRIYVMIARAGMVFMHNPPPASESVWELPIPKSRQVPLHRGHNFVEFWQIYGRAVSAAYFDRARQYLPPDWCPLPITKSSIAIPILVCLIIIIISTEGALSIAPPRDFHPSHLIPHIGFGLTSVSDGIS